MTSPDRSPTSTPTGLPEPPSGVGAVDLATASNDPAELRDLLDRARERLAFYESFDRIIGENIRRSGELMVETVALREEAQALAAQSARDHAGFEATREADRQRYREIVRAALDEAAGVQPVIDGLIRHLEAALAQLDAMSTDTPEPAAAAVPVEDSAGDEAAPATPAIEPTPETAPTTPESAQGPPAEPAGPRTIQVLAHRVPNAKTAVALQAMLRDLDGIESVEAREFANGELRLAISATVPLPADILAAWLSANDGELTGTTDSVTEVTFRA